MTKLMPLAALGAALALAPALVPAAQAETIGGLAFADTTRHTSAMQPLDDYTIAGDAELMSLPALNDDGTIRAIVEIPTGTSAKWEISKENPNAVYWEYKDEKPRIVNYLGYPGNYGAIPGTALPKELAATATRWTCWFWVRPFRVARSSACA